MDHTPLKVEIVAADHAVWSGESVNIIARTTEGDIGILPGHEPLMAALVPCVVDVETTDGRRESVAIDGGFISVANGNVWILAQEGILGQEVSLEAARREFDELSGAQSTDESSEDTEHRQRVLEARIRAAERVSAR